MSAEKGVADAAQMRWLILDHLMDTGVPHSQWAELTEKLYGVVVGYRESVNIEEIDRNARGYGWEAAKQLSPGEDLPEVLEVSYGNPFVRDDRREVSK